MKNLFAFLVFGLLFISCGPDEEMSENEVPGSQAEMIVEKNGTSYTVTVFNNTYISESLSDQTGVRMDLRAQVDGGTLTLVGFELGLAKSSSQWNFN